MFLALNAATVEAEHGGILHAPQSDNDSIQIRRRPLNRAEAQSLCLYAASSAPSRITPTPTPAGRPPYLFPSFFASAISFSALNLLDSVAMSNIHLLSF
ncbi:MAG: hypothetical protein DMG49_02785 [Acidobacteria bacterium]|nr:MAG: hypothetical protein DMG49_02785 [Acidobacteriota bacterium]